MPNDLKKRLISTLPRDLLIDLFDMAAARALKAYEIVRDGADLDTKRANESIGQLRFRMQEKGFVETCQKHGGVILVDGVIPGVAAKAFQPFARFGGEGPGVVLALATMPTPRELPAKNRSRLAGVTLNFNLTQRLFTMPDDPQPGDIFVCLVVARDRASPGLIDEIAVGVIDDEYKAYLFYEPIAQFLDGYGADDAGKGPEGPNPPSGEPPLVRLKRTRKPFTPPEDDPGDAANDHKKEG
ncbi:hypothetical protein V7S57_11840 [Caulobacter sp. CCNWLY153]|jgi:hypothetical protein|uniref:Uncharacterized protein n=1 Tax=Caulobacter radicis TaxID=2172650 RepID=A0A2T9JB30_9CAUL|nr:hypothetical protein [Caulobacter radicis]PVM79436.1 hypothetical protein DDF65_15180 [Caulobacter radicis]